MSQDGKLISARDLPSENNSHKSKKPSEIYAAVHFPASSQ